MSSAKMPENLNSNKKFNHVNLEVHADYFVRIKTEQIKPILQVILQLYGIKFVSDLR
jgi:hypothetical protein